jgi:hypothetical protein
MRMFITVFTWSSQWICSRTVLSVLQFHHNVHRNLLLTPSSSARWNSEKKKKKKKKLCMTFSFVPSVLHIRSTRTAWLHCYDNITRSVQIMERLTMWFSASFHSLRRRSKYPPCSLLWNAYLHLRVKTRFRTCKIRKISSVTVFMYIWRIDGDSEKFSVS